MSQLPPLPRQVEPIAYMSPAPRRPGLITVIGVISIIVASLAAMANLGAAASFYVAQMVVQMQATLRVTPIPMAGSAVLADGPRRLALDGFALRQPLDERQRAQLDVLLAQVGDEIIPLAEDELSAEALAANITSAGAIPPDEDMPGEGRFYVLAAGRVEVFADRAVFRPADGGDVVTVSADAGESGILVPARVDAVVQAVNNSLPAGNKLNPRQLAALKRELAGPDQVLIDPKAGNPASQIQVARPMPDGGVFIFSNASASLQIDRQGRITGKQAGFRGGAAPAAGTTPVTINRPAYVVCVLEVFASFVLAALLFTAGILVLRDHPLGLRLHWLYVWVRMPLALVGVWAWAIFWRDVSAPSGGAAETWAAVLFASGVPAAGLIYPLALLVALRSRTVGRYAGSWGG